MSVSYPVIRSKSDWNNGESKKNVVSSDRVLQLFLDLVNIKKEIQQDLSGNYYVYKPADEVEDLLMDPRQVVALGYPYTHTFYIDQVCGPAGSNTEVKMSEYNVTGGSILSTSGKGDIFNLPSSNGGYIGKSYDNARYINRSLDPNSVGLPGGCENGKIYEHANNSPHFVESFNAEGRRLETGAFTGYLGVLGGDINDIAVRPSSDISNVILGSYYYLKSGDAEEDKKPILINKYTGPSYPDGENNQSKYMLTMAVPVLTRTYPYGKRNQDDNGESVTRLIHKCGRIDDFIQLHQDHNVSAIIDSDSGYNTFYQRIAVRVPFIEYEEAEAAVSPAPKPSGSGGGEIDHRSDLQKKYLFIHGLQYINEAFNKEIYNSEDKPSSGMVFNRKDDDQIGVGVDVDSDPYSNSKSLAYFRTFSTLRKYGSSSGDGDNNLETSAPNCGIRIAFAAVVNEKEDNNLLPVDIEKNEYKILRHCNIGNNNSLIYTIPVWANTNEVINTHLPCNAEVSFHAGGASLSNVRVSTYNPNNWSPPENAHDAKVTSITSTSAGVTISATKLIMNEKGGYQNTGARSPIPISKAETSNFPSIIVDQLCMPARKFADLFDYDYYQSNSDYQEDGPYKHSHIRDFYSYYTNSTSAVINNILGVLTSENNPAFGGSFNGAREFAIEYKKIKTRGTSTNKMGIAPRFYQTNTNKHNFVLGGMYFGWMAFKKLLISGLNLDGDTNNNFLKFIPGPDLIKPIADPDKLGVSIFGECQANNTTNRIATIFINDNYLYVIMTDTCIDYDDIVYVGDQNIPVGWSGPTKAWPLTSDASTIPGDPPTDSKLGSGTFDENRVGYSQRGSIVFPKSSGRLKIYAGTGEAAAQITEGVEIVGDWDSIDRRPESNPGYFNTISTGLINPTIFCQTDYFKSKYVNLCVYPPSTSDGMPTGQENMVPWRIAIPLSAITSTTDTITFEWEFNEPPSSAITIRRPITDPDLPNSGIYRKLFNDINPTPLNNTPLYYFRGLLAPRYPSVVDSSGSSSDSSGSSSDETILSNDDYFKKRWNRGLNSDGIIRQVYDYSISGGGGICSISFPGDSLWTLSYFHTDYCTYPAEDEDYPNDLLFSPPTSSVPGTYLFGDPDGHNTILKYTARRFNEEDGTLNSLEYCEGDITALTTPTPENYAQFYSNYQDFCPAIQNTAYTWEKNLNTDDSSDPGYGYVKMRDDIIASDPVPVSITSENKQVIRVSFPISAISSTIGENPKVFDFKFQMRHIEDEPKIVTTQLGLGAYLDSRISYNDNYSTTSAATNNFSPKNRALGLRLVSTLSGESGESGESGDSGFTNDIIEVPSGQSSPWIDHNNTITIKNFGGMGDKNAEIPHNVTSDPPITLEELNTHIKIYGLDSNPKIDAVEFSKEFDSDSSDSEISVMLINNMGVETNTIKYPNTVSTITSEGLSGYYPPYHYEAFTQNALYKIINTPMNWSSFPLP